jgi:hypothetical protein
MRFKILQAFARINQTAIKALSLTRRQAGASLFGCARVSCAVALVLFGCDSVRALQLTLDSVALMPDNTASGVYTATGDGTSAWDSQLTTLSSSGTSPSVVGASASAETRYAFAMSTVGPSPNGAASFTATEDYAITFTVTNDDPIHNVAYTLEISTTDSGVVPTLGRVGSASHYSNSSPLMVLPGGGTSGPSEGSQGGPNIGNVEYGTFGPGGLDSKLSALTGTHTYTIEFI